MNFVTSRFSLLFLSAAIIGCSTGDLTAPQQVLSSDVPESVLRWSCYDESDPHCLNEWPLGDPSPTADGVFLGDDFTPESCSIGNDVDLDGLDDFCEYQLALVFRPMLNTSDNSTGRETYWATQPMGSGIRIVYMIGYYDDPGLSTCWWNPPVGCTPHEGDNEFIVTQIDYDTNTEHWVLSQQFFSAHWGCTATSSCDFSGWKSGTSLEYPTKHRSYSLVYASLNKHANYETRSACNSGGQNAADDCSSGSDEGRLTVLEGRNAGSFAYQFINLTTSVDNPTTRTGRDWLWSDVRFCGWNVYSTSNREGCSPTSYGDVLATFLAEPI